VTIRLWRCDPALTQAWGRARIGPPPARVSLVRRAVPRFGPGVFDSDHRQLVLAECVVGISAWQLHLSTVQIDDLAELFLRVVTPGFTSFAEIPVGLAS
jgi:hypothetical protein